MMLACKEEIIKATRILIRLDLKNESKCPPKGEAHHPETKS
jgi:hypothetical protein